MNLIANIVQRYVLLSLITLFVMPVMAGQMSLHHTDLVHASGSNDSDDRRLGFAISYIPAHLKPTGPVRPSALCVRGQDHGHFLAERRLKHALSAQAHEEHKQALALFVQCYFSFG